MQLSGAMGLPLRYAVPLFVGIAALFLAVMGYFVREGLGNSGSALGTATPAPAVSGAPAPIASSGPGSYTVPQTGSGPAAAPRSLPGNAVGGGGPAAGGR